MGSDPKKSVLNKFNQVHACKNVFVTTVVHAVVRLPEPVAHLHGFTARARDTPSTNSRRATYE
jgi:hypothetical protein